VENDDRPIAPLPSRPRLASWLPRVLVESALIVFSVLFALAVDEWRDHRASVARAHEALRAITAELQSNRDAARRASGIHARIKAQLSTFVEAKKLPDAKTMTSGVFQPATLLQTAWVTARESGGLDQVPFDLVLELSRVYERQNQYMTMSTAMANDIYIDVRRRGLDQAFREGFEGFILLATDFGNREERLAAVYDKAIERIAAAQP
jgi:hypothetical protein